MTISGIDEKAPIAAPASPSPLIGLTSEEADRRRKTDGENPIPDIGDQSTAFWRA